jgi:hypothetical protein
MPALKQRMTDTNKNLTLQAVQLLGKLATAMGRPIAREDRGCLAAAIRCLTDPKPMVSWVWGSRRRACLNVEEQKHVHGEARVRV